VSVLYPRHAATEALFGALGTVVCVDMEDQLRVLQAATALMGPFYQIVVTTHQWMTDHGAFFLLLLLLVPTEPQHCIPARVKHIQLYYWKYILTDTSQPVDLSHARAGRQPGISDGAAAAYSGAFFRCISADSAAKRDGAGLAHRC
jgi:hypothetical protein